MLGNVGRHGTIVSMDDDRCESDEISVLWDILHSGISARMKAGKHGQYDLVEEAGYNAWTATQEVPPV